MDTTRIIKNLMRFDARLRENQVLHRIGLRLTNRIKLEIRRQKIAQSGATRNSVSYKVDGSELTVDAMGTKYAKYHEFGTKPSAKMARFLKWRMGQMKKSGAAIPRPKGVIAWNGRGKNQTARILPRPFFWTSIQKEEKNIIKLLQLYYSLEGK